MRLKSKDIAKALGLSPATVSLAINNRPGVNEKTRQRILDFMDEQEEKLAEMKRAKKNKKKGSLLLLSYRKFAKKEAKEEPGQNGSNMPQELYGELKELVNRAGYDFLCKEFYEKTQSQADLKNFIKKQNVRGIYLLAGEMCAEDLRIFKELSVPVVAGDNCFYEEGVDSFVIDNEQGIREGLEYLHRCGHYNIIYLAGTEDNYDCLERRREFLWENPQGRIWYLGRDEDSLLRSMSACLEQTPDETTAFFLENVKFFPEILRALARKNIRVPEDISFIAFDTEKAVRMSGEEWLTRVCSDVVKRHKTAVHHLLWRLSGEKGCAICTYYKTGIVRGKSVRRWCGIPEEESDIKMERCC